MKKKFLRRTWNKYSKLGKRRKKKQVWRSPKGRHNKMRKKRKSYSKIVKIGGRNAKKLRGKLMEKSLIFINNVRELEKIKNNQIGVLQKVGKKRKIEIVKKAKELGIKLQNVNVEKFLKKVESKKEEISDRKGEIENKNKENKK